MKKTCRAIFCLPKKFVQKLFLRSEKLKKKTAIFFCHKMFVSQKCVSRKLSREKKPEECDRGFDKKFFVNP